MVLALLRQNGGRGSEWRAVRQMLLEELVGVAPPTRFRADPKLKIIGFGFGT